MLGKQSDIDLQGATLAIAAGRALRPDHAAFGVKNRFP
jgi:hypothetical protein